MGWSLPRKLAEELARRGRGRAVNVAALQDVGLTPPAGPPGFDLTATVPVPPSTNNLFVTIGRRRFKSPAYRAWLAVAVPLLARLRRPEVFPVRVLVTAFAINEARDVDNLAKPVSDALVTAGVLPGDSIGAGVWETLQRYRPDGPDGVAVVRIEAVEV